MKLKQPAYADSGRAVALRLQLQPGRQQISGQVFAEVIVGADGPAVTFFRVPGATVVLGILQFVGNGIAF